MPGFLGTFEIFGLGSFLGLTTDPQDDCRIGSVDPAQYEAIERRVAELPPLPWRKAAEAADSGPNPVLTDYLRGAIAPVAGADERLATLHAALGRGEATYDWASGYRRYSSDGALVVTYAYAIDTWDMGLWRPVCR